MNEALVGFPDVAPVGVGTLIQIGSRTAYRQRAKLVADEHGRLGLYRAGTHEIEDLPECIVLDPMVQATVAATRALLREYPVLRGLDVARVDEGTLVTLITAQSVNESALSVLTARLAERQPGIQGIARSERADGAVQLLGKDLRTVRGAPCGRRTMHNAAPYHYVSHGSFVQAHREVASAIQHRVVKALRDANVDPPARVLELYAGSGALALLLAQEGFDVTAVESFGPACEQAREAAREQKLRLKVVSANAAAGAQRSFESNEVIEAVLVNPPRRGLDPEVRRAIARIRPRVMTYVSCEPNTLARDLSHLALLGLAAKELTPFDMMPLTDQVETVAILERSNELPLEVLHEDDGLLAVNKRAHEPLLPAGDFDTSLLERVRRRPGYEDALPVSPVDEDASGICLFACGAGRLRELEPDLALAISTYLTLVRGSVRHGGKIARPLVAEGKRCDAVTRFRRQEVIAGHSLVRADVAGDAQPEQIRRHFAAIGHPVLGDARHGDLRSNRYVGLKHTLDRAFLHCERVALPLRGRSLTFQASLAPDLKLTLDSLRNGRATRRETP